jgi:heme oxygenase
VVGAALALRRDRHISQLAVSAATRRPAGAKAAPRKPGTAGGFAFGGPAEVPGGSFGRLRKRSSFPHMMGSDVTFSSELKEGTKTSHSSAENTKFIAQFLKGALDREEYRKMMADLYYVYSTMEKRIGETQDPLADTLKQWQVKLNRTASLEEDLKHYYGPSWRNEVVPSESCNAYCSRINEVAEKDPYLLIAHHYVRYIGDLSGGQILKNIAGKALNQSKGEGLRFYDFPSIDDARVFKKQYREVLDGLELDEQKRMSLIAEANYGFRLNMDIFDELQGNVVTSLWYNMWSGYITAMAARHV